MTAPAPFFVTGGTLAPDAPSYLPRHADTQIVELLRAGRYAYLLNARQMGKSSLCVRARRALEAQGIRTTLLDQQKFGTSATNEQWYRGMLERVGYDLKLRAEAIAYWREHADLSPLERLFGALRDVVLEKSDAPVVVFIDEIDAVRGMAFPTDEFFGAIRQCHNARADDPAYHRLTFCLIGTVAPSDLVADIRLSPFNVGERVVLADFRREELTPLEAAVPGGAATLDRVASWTGGHPYLTQRLCAHLAATGSTDVDAAVGTLFLSRSDTEVDGNIKDVRNTVLRLGGEGAGFDRVDLLTRYGQVAAGKRVPDDDTDGVCAALRLSGLVRAEGGFLRPRCKVYAKVFDAAWVRGHLPDAEVRRQRAAVARARWQVGSIAAAVLIVAVVALIDKYGSLARSRDVATNRLAYFDNINLLQRAVKDSEYRMAGQLLDETKRYPELGFEWHYLNRLLHCLELVELTGHSDLVRSVAFSPDGRRIVTGSNDQTAKVWDAATGREEVTLRGHSGFVTSVAFSPDGRRIVTGSRDNSAKVWDATTGREEVTLKGGHGTVMSVAFSPDGRRIVTGSADNSAKVWDAATGREKKTLRGHSGFLTSVAFSPDGRRIVTGSDDQTVRVWDAATGREEVTLKGHSNQVTSVAFSPDGRRIVTGSADNSALLWDAATGREQVTLKGHIDTVLSVAFSPDGRRIVTGSADNSAKVWDAATGREQKTLKGHIDTVLSVAFSPDGRRIVTGSADNSAKVWDAATGREQKTLKGHSNQVTSIAFSPDGRRIVTGSFDKTARVWDAATGREEITLKGHSSFVTSVAFSPDGKRIVTGSNDQTAKVWDAATGGVEMTLKWHSDWTLSVAFSPDGRRIVTGSFDKTAKVWDAATGGVEMTLKGHSDKVFSVAFSPDGRRIVTGSADNSAKVWDATTGREEMTLKGHSDKVLSVVFSPDGKRIVTGSGDNTVKVWDAVMGREALTLKGHSDWVRSVAFAPDGRRIVTGSYDKTAKVWEGTSAQGSAPR